jgi:hypothetical protein
MIYKSAQSHARTAALRRLHPLFPPRRLQVILEELAVTLRLDFA